MTSVGAIDRPFRRAVKVRAGLIGLLAGVWASSGWWCARPAYAVPAHPAGVVVRQPDGAAVTVFLRGDEHFHWHQDKHGYLVTKLRETGQWVYALEVGGAVVGTKHVVGRSDPRALGLDKLDADRIRAAAQVRGPARNAAVQVPGRVPITGTLRNLVVLVDFSDMAVAYTRQEFDDLFNQVAYTTDGAVGSVKDYFHEVSYTALTSQSTVVDAVTLNNGYVYYGANDAWGYDLRPREMVAEALVKLETRGFDFSLMDGDGDGWVDCLTVVHAGPDEAYGGNDPNYIWSHKWQMTSVVTYDGVNLWPYHTVPARRGWDSTPSSWGITRIGVVCHEMGHILGLPDLYDTTYSSRGVGDFCLMAGGSWNGNDGSSPAHMSAWCKVTLGWVSPTVISSAGSYSLAQVETAAEIYKLQGDLPANEYFLLENRQGVGFDAAMPGTSRGILIWHVDENQPGNTDPSHYKVDVEEASGTQHLELNQNDGDDSDYFRAGNAAEFSATTSPNNAGYLGTPLGLAIENIGATGATMSFVLPDANTVSISGHIRTAGGDGIDGVSVAGDSGGGSDTTDPNGHYELTPQSGWSGTITPTKTGYAFVPVNRSHSNVTSDLTGQDFQGTSGPPLQVMAQADPNLVASGASSTLTAGASGGSGSYTYLWNTGQTAAAITVNPTATTTYTVTVADGDGQEAQASVTVEVASPVSAEATASPSPVASGGAVTLSASASGGLGPYAYAWHTGQTTDIITVNPTATTTYTVTVTDSLGQQTQASARVEVASQVSVTAAADSDVIAAGGMALLTASASGGARPYTYQWTTGQTTEVIIVNPTATTTHTVVVTDGLGQQAQVTVRVNVASSVDLTAKATPSAIRAGESSALTATATGGVGPYAYRWSTGESSSSIVVRPTGPTGYGVIATDSLGQTATASVTVEVTRVAAVVEQIGGVPCLVPALLTSSMVFLVGWTAVARARSRRKRRPRER